MLKIKHGIYEYAYKKSETEKKIYYDQNTTLTLAKNSQKLLNHVSISDRDYDSKHYDMIIHYLKKNSDLKSFDIQIGNISQKSLEALSHMFKYFLGMKELHLKFFDKLEKENLTKKFFFKSIVFLKNLRTLYIEIAQSSIINTEVLKVLFYGLKGLKMLQKLKLSFDSLDSFDNEIASRLGRYFEKQT